MSGKAKRNGTNPNPTTLVPPLLSWFARAARDLPWRRTLDPYGIWISEIMLQQTQVKTVIPYWERWIGELPMIASLARAKPAKVLKLWEGLGYYTRARNLQKAAQQILEKHSGKFPRNFEDIIALPGIGRYTAGAISSIAFNQPTPILDGNVIRVLTRLFGIADDPRAKETNARLWSLAQELVTSAARLPEPALPGGFRSAGSCSLLNQALMELGATVCTPKQPRCDKCPVRSNCSALRSSDAESFPRMAPRVPATPLMFAAALVERNGHWIVRQRPPGVVNAHLWEFPNVQLGAGENDSLRHLRKAFGLAGRKLDHFQTVRHSITRYRITLDAYAVSLPDSAAPARLTGEWLPLSTLEQLPFTAAHRRLLHNLLRNSLPLSRARADAKA